MRLTRRQQELLRYIHAITERRQLPPTMREMMDALGLASTNSVVHHLSNLEALGALKREPRKPWSCALTAAGRKAAAAADVPAGRMRAGTSVARQTRKEA